MSVEFKTLSVVIWLAAASLCGYWLGLTHGKQYKAPKVDQATTYDVYGPRLFRIEYNEVATVTVIDSLTIR